MSPARSPHGLEIERKFRLSGPPDPARLAERATDALRIEQVYLGREGARRIRRIEHADGSVEHRLTEKGPTDGIVREEREQGISPDDYRRLLEEADPGRRPIRKTRYLVPHGNQVLEIDLFDEPAGLAVVEVELRDEAEPVTLPGWLGDHRDVSLDPRYLNASLARLDPDGGLP